WSHATQQFPFRRGINGGVIGNLRSISSPFPDDPPLEGEPEEIEPTGYNSLSRQKSTTEAPQTIAFGQSPTTNTIDNIILGAIKQSRTIADPIAESYSLGQRGRLYELTQDYEQAQGLTQKALRLTEEMSFPDGRYRWEWQQGRLFSRQGQRQEAILAYGNAVKTLKEIRSNLLFIDAEVQFSFRDNAEPVYRELVELLLSAEKTELDESTLDLAVQQIDNLQLSELENFLRCDLTGTTTITQFEVDANTAVLHPIILKNRLGVISQFQDKKEFTDFDISEKEVETAIEQIRSDLSLAPDRTPEIRDTAKLLHQWLIAPIEDELKQRDIKTLVFVLDGSLRNIPMAVLFDGEKYLVEKYAIAVAPELELFTPTPLTSDLKVFTGGVGTPQEIGDLSFATIKNLDAELDVISELFGPQPPVTNQNFNGRTLQAQLSTGNFSGIHIKTHGLFSSDPEETFIVGYNELIKGEALGNLIQSGSRQGATPIELLVLSACSTATGDNRAILGLAGIAVRAGARSTLSTLWEAEDGPNTQLMIRFYQELKKPNITRADALRNAQLALINEDGYKAPHLWSTYVLVGNWR
ncbi:MAG: CHAT domain-containing protein, partial [Cyanobacteria bacterium P01_D01_bin.56]